MTSKIGWMLVLSAATFCSTAGQSSSGALPPPPPGFEAVPHSPSQKAMKDRGIADSVEAQKKNDNWPNCFDDPKIVFSYSWTTAPGAEMHIQMMAEAPEDPPSKVNGVATEPAGKQRYKGGVLKWQKVSTPAIGATGAKCASGHVITYDGTWVGYINGKLIGVGVARLYGSKTAGQAWIDEYIPKVQAAAAAH